jgi:NTE family protein
VGLALGSGGWKGLAHLGVLRALEELEIRPTVYAGASSGALVAAAAASRIRLDHLEQVAAHCRQNPLFRVDLGNLLRHGVRTPALFRETPLRTLCEELFGESRFEDLPTPALVATLDLSTGETIWWGSEERRHALIADAVYASCALPGLLPPGMVDARLCIDGSVLDPLGLQGLRDLVDRIIVVELGPVRAASDPRARPRASSLWWKAQSLVTHDLSRRLLREWDGPPLHVIRPTLRGVEVLTVAEPVRVIRAGYEAALSVLRDPDDEQVELIEG